MQKEISELKTKLRVCEFQKSELKYKLELTAAKSFDFPVNVPELKREDQIALATFFASGPGFLLLTRLNATLCNMGIMAAENKQFAGERACEARGYGEALRQIKSLSVVPTASDIPAPGQLDEAEIMLNKVSP